MPIYFILLSLVAGICLGFSILYLFVGLRRQEGKWLNLSFALFAFGYAATLVDGIRWYGATTVSEYLAANRWDAVFVVLAFVALIWYVAIYTGVRPMTLLWSLSAAFVTLGIVQIVRPNMLYGNIRGLTYIELPWGERLAQLDASTTIWLSLFLIAQLAMLGFIIYAFICQYRRGEQQAAAILGFGMLWFVVAIFFEILGQSGIIDYFPLGEFGFLGIAVVMSLQMANFVIKTEGELARHRENLVTLVDERTIELKQSNDRLSLEVGERRRAEEALRQSYRTTRALLNAPPNPALLIDPDGTILDINEVGAAGLNVPQSRAKGANIYDLLDPEILESRRARVAELIAAKQSIRWEDVRAGHHFDNSLYPVLDDQGQVARIAIYATDITERHQAEQTLNRRLEELRILHQTAHALAHVTDLQTTLQTVSETITFLFDVLFTHILIARSDRAELDQLIGFEREVGPLGPIPLLQPMLNAPVFEGVLVQGEPVVVSGYPLQQLSSAGQTVRRIRSPQSCILVPMVVGGMTIGLISIATEQHDRTFTPDELKLAETVAGDIAAAIENARLLEQAKTAGAIQERSRLARELHDSVTQTMYSVSIMAEAMPRLLERNLAEAKRSAAYLRQTTLGALAEMRTLLFELRPGTLEKASLNTLLQELADALTGRTRVPVDMMVEGQIKMPPEIKVVLYRIAQEAFNNINKHARATRVRVTLTGKPDQVVLTICDNGQGFVPEEVSGERMGLKIMRERSEEIGARLTIKSNLNQGTQIEVVWSPAAERSKPPAALHAERVSREEG